MWYFTWVLGVGFALFLAILNALWLENADARMAAQRNPKQDNHEHENAA